MRTFRKTLTAALLGAALATSAPAQDVPQSFHLTNAIAGATAYAGPPTNNINPTNQLCLGNGRYIPISDCDRALLIVQFTNSATNVGNFSFGLARSALANPQTISDFENTPGYTYSVAGQGEGVVCWMTNLDNIVVGNIRALGIVNPSNAAASGTIGPLISTNVVGTNTYLVTNPIISLIWKYQRVKTGP